VLVEIESEHITEVASAFGEPGKAAEAVDEARAYPACGAAVGPHLADQLLAPMALAGRGAFRTSSLTEHSTTNIAVIRRFLGVRIEAMEDAGGVTTVTIS
jgi:RNA 3'-terminal phosphate cyclase (ATP)